MLLCCRLSCHGGGAISCTQVWNGSDHRLLLLSNFLTWLPVQSTQLPEEHALGSTVRPDSRSYKYVVTLTRSREDEHYVYNVTVDNDGDVAISEIEIAIHSAVRCVPHKVAEMGQPRVLLCLVCKVKHLSEAVDGAS